MNLDVVFYGKTLDTCTCTQAGKCTIKPYNMYMYMQYCKMYILYNAMYSTHETILSVSFWNIKA